MRRLSRMCLILAIGALGFPVPEVAAYDDEVHYALTYYMARGVGYTPEQAWRLASACVQVDYAYDTEPVQFNYQKLVVGGKTIKGVYVGMIDTQEGPSAMFNQGPRRRFHAFATEPSSGPPSTSWGDMTPEERRLYYASERGRIGRQAQVLYEDGVIHRNPGVWLHFWQDIVPHTGYAAAWGHYDLVLGGSQRMATGRPQGVITDWLSFRSQNPEEPRCLEQGDDPSLMADSEALYRGTQKWLDRYMRQTSTGRQRPLPPEPVDQIRAAILAAIRAKSKTLGRLNCPALGLFTSWTEVLAYKVNDKKYRPDMDATRSALSDFFFARGMDERDVPEPKYPVTYVIQAKRFKFFAFRDQVAGFYPVDPSGRWSAKAPGAEDDDWVLWGDLQVHLDYPEDYDSTETFQLIVWSRRNQNADREAHPEHKGRYELKAASEEWPRLLLRGDQPPLLRNIPVGAVDLELRRNDGKSLWLHDVAILKKLNKDVRMRVDWGDSSVASRKPASGTSSGKRRLKKIRVERNLQASGVTPIGDRVEELAPTERTFTMGYTREIPAGSAGKSGVRASISIGVPEEIESKDTPITVSADADVTWVLQSDTGQAFKPDKLGWMKLMLTDQVGQTRELISTAERPLLPGVHTLSASDQQIFRGSVGFNFRLIFDGHALWVSCIYSEEP